MDTENITVESRGLDKVDNFCYRGSMVEKEGEAEENVNIRTRKA